MPHWRDEIAKMTPAQVSMHSSSAASRGVRRPWTTCANFVAQPMNGERQIDRLTEIETDRGGERRIVPARQLLPYVGGGGMKR